SGTEDHEILLASFYKPLNDYLTYNWMKFHPKLSIEEQEYLQKEIPKLLKERDKFFTSFMILDQLCETDQNLKKELYQCMQAFPRIEDQKQAVENIITSAPIKDKVAEIQKEYFLRACKNPDNKELQDVLKSHNVTPETLLTDPNFAEAVPHFV